MHTFYINVYTNDSQNPCLKIKPPHFKFASYAYVKKVFSVSCSPFLLNATLQHHLDKYLMSHPEFVNKITSSLCVNDVVMGAGYEETTYKLYLESKEVLKKGGFNLRKFVERSIIFT